MNFTFMDLFLERERNGLKFGIDSVKMRENAFPLLLWLWGTVGLLLPSHHMNYCPEIQGCGRCFISPHENISRPLPRYTTLNEGRAKAPNCSRDFFFSLSCSLSWTDFFKPSQNIHSLREQPTSFIQSYSNSAGFFLTVWSKQASTRLYLEWSPVALSDMVWAILGCWWKSHGTVSLVRWFHAFPKLLVNTAKEFARELKQVKATTEKAMLESLNGPVH